MSSPHKEALEQENERQPVLNRFRELVSEINISKYNQKEFARIVDEIHLQLLEDELEKYYHLSSI